MLSETPSQRQDRLSCSMIPLTAVLSLTHNHFASSPSSFSRQPTWLMPEKPIVRHSINVSLLLHSHIMTACPFGTDYSALSQSSKVWSFPDLHGDECKHPHLVTKTEYISLIRESFSVKLITERLVPASERECIIDLLSWSTLLQKACVGLFIWGRRRFGARKQTSQQMRLI